MDTLDEMHLVLREYGWWLVPYDDGIFEPCWLWSHTKIDTRFTTWWGAEEGKSYWLDRIFLGQVVDAPTTVADLRRRLTELTTATRPDPV